MRVKGLRSDSDEKDNAYGYMAFNMRATNDYRNVSAMAYLVNVFQDGDVKEYFDDLDIPTSEDLYAISTLVQWLWRSRIRENVPRPVSVFIPSERMRGLFREWLAADSTQGFVERKMAEAREALERLKKGRWTRPKSTEVGFEASVVRMIATSTPRAIAAE
jgi:hypothetical protein